jgi:DNA processing protein
MNKIGPVRFKRLLNFFPDMKSLWLTADFSDLTDAGLEEKIAEDFIIKRNRINPDEEFEKLMKEQIKVVTLTDETYPKLLKEIYCPPPLLYYRGDLENLTDCAIAIVGTRKISVYGKQMVEEIVAPLAKNKISIVSGLALGIDAEAHLIALKEKTHTAAVLGSGLDRQNIYPSSNRFLAEKILAENGCIISEYPIGTLPLKQNFPARNRLISGLTIATVVIEAGESSGSLITAAYALEQNREIFAVPGNLTNPNSKGTNKLLKQGAHVVTEAEDILEILNLRQLVEFKKNKKIIPESPQEEKILQFLNQEPIHIDQLVAKTKLPAATINASLTLMELKGKIKNLGNMNYVICG